MTRHTISPLYNITAIQYHRQQIKMSTEAMMPISADALHYRTILFELSKPVTIPPQIFDEIWPYVDSVYSKLQQELLQAYGTVRVQKYECRLRKSRKSSVAQVADTDVDGTAVTIERLDEHTHTHDIEESFQIKKPSILVGYIKSEAAKNYSASQIYHVIHSAGGTHEGAERLKELGGSSLKTKDMTF
ncbi:hypothetical protein BGX38DRAFT_1325934 [Terfezia claveryi]|nr:hypothetical protein BGX38DRAFT_1325934 [Terfezia claveryi]